MKTFPTAHHVPRARRALKVAIGILAALLLTAACGSGGSAAQSAGSGSPREGGELTFLIDSLGDTWIPNNSAISSFQGNIWGLVTDKLVYVDDKGAASPWLAQSWEQNADATEFTLHLKSGVTFSDGTPLDAAAVVANLNMWSKGDATRGITPIGLFPKTYKSAQAVDPATVKVDFTAPTLGFIPTLGYHGSMLISPKTLALPAAGQADLSQDIGSGPYVVQSWKQNDNVVLKKRPDYNWAPAALGQQGPAKIDTITYKQVTDQQVRSSSVASGQADVAFNPAPKQLASFKAQGLQVAAPRYLGFVNGFAINTKVAPFDDLAVRQALQYGINRQEILSTVYTPDWLAATSFIQSNVPGATDHSSSFAFDAAKSEALLDQAGWVKGPDGIRAKNGTKLALTLYPNPYLGASKDVDELVAQQLGKIGFQVTLQAFDVVTYGQRVKIDTPGVPAYEITRSFIDAGTVGGVLTDLNKGENWFNVGQSDPKLTQLATGIAGASDPKARNAQLDQLQGYVLDQGYFVPLTQIVQRLYLISPKVHGISFNGVAYANFYTAWIDD